MMASSARNFEYDAVYSQRSHRDLMRAGYVLVSEEWESGSEYSGSTCCCCSSCASSCSSDEYSGDEDDNEEEEAYWSDCSACWARRNALRRGRASWRAGDGASGERGANVYAEGRESRQDHHHHHTRHHSQHRHGGRNESHPRGQQNSNYPLRNNNNNNNNNTTNYNAAETPAYRGLADRIVLGTRQFYQGEDSLRHLRSWIRVLEDIQRRRYATTGRGTNNSAAPASAAPATTATGLGRASDASSRGAAAGEDGRMRQARAYPRGGGRDHFMSGGRSISTNRRRRLR